MVNALSEFNHDLTEEKVKPLRENGYTMSRDPSPNRGASMPDHIAVGPESCSKASWRKANGVEASKQIRLVKLAHMRYQHPDLQQITNFLRDFGMHVVKKTETRRWYRGYGPDQYVYYAQQGPKKFLGGAFEVESYEELEKIAKLPGTVCLTNGVEEMSDAPGGGHIVSVEDPEGFPVNFIFGQSKPETRKMPGKLRMNDESTKARVKQFQRFEPGPAEVYKLGHFGLCVKDFETQMSFYTKNFNIIPSDLLYVPVEFTADGKPERRLVAMFAHIDRGQDLADHHTMFLTSLGPDTDPHVHHCSFEIHDFDTQALGHQWLAQKGYKSVWGVGRHILGSQIFDYWWDANGFMVEHYADGDLVNEETPLAYGPAGHEGLAVWGPEVPQAFLD
ncbi:trihydroxytoluene oxygenase [Mytilinidion resinicola]|uniref:Trihydroxytoluene oxygenase n=1 Tax=Mytilinidion resinicola TaxID=574789 RepID=A0A6A6YLF0_9PEZI|nr:trihydroxytoluene oxygenase [Mytilinidion resinicola]KAF2808805.1 trihydroxytoluene oxygenase [Mytilinidion resinicola]